MKFSLPSSAMDFSPESSSTRASNSLPSIFTQTFLQHTSIPNIHKWLPSPQASEPKKFPPHLFSISSAAEPAIPHLTSMVSNLFNSLTSNLNSGTAPEEHPWLRFGRELGQKINGRKNCVRNMITNAASLKQQRVVPCFASFSAGGQESSSSIEIKSIFQLALSAEEVAARLSDVPVYTVSNYNNEFVLVSEPNGQKSLGLLCFRKEDAEAILAQVQLRQPGISRGAKIVSLSLEKVYTLKVEGIAFRFVPNPVQIQNALEIKSKDLSKAFDGVPVFQSDLVVVRKKNRSFMPLYFCKEDLDRDIEKILENNPRSAVSSILVGSLEGALKTMEESKENSEWENLIFIPPGKSYTEYIRRIVV